MEQRQALIEALDLIKVMGGIIRRFDEGGDYGEYWLDDGDYVPAALEIAKGLDDDEPANRIEKTEDNYEAYLNELFYNESTWGQTKERYLYLTSRDRNRYISYDELHYRYTTKQIGTTLRELDSIAFTVGFNEWNP